MNKEKTYCGSRLKKLREDMGLTMDMFVEDINARFGTTFDKSRVSRWERNITDPDLVSAKYISQYYNVSLDYIIGLTTVRTPSRLLASASRKQAEETSSTSHKYTHAPRIAPERPTQKLRSLSKGGYDNYDDDDFEFEFLNTDDTTT